MKHRFILQALESSRANMELDDQALYYLALMRQHRPECFSVKSTNERGWFCFFLSERQRPLMDKVRFTQLSGQGGLGGSAIHLDVDRDAAIFLTLGQGSGMKHDDKAHPAGILFHFSRS